MRLSFSSLRARLLLLIGLSMLPVLGLTLFTYFAERSQILGQVRNQLRLLSCFASDSHERLIETTLQLLAAMSAIPNVRSLDAGVCGSDFARIMEEGPRYTDMGIILPDGGLLCSASCQSEPTTYGDQGWFRASLKEPSGTVSQLVDRWGTPVLHFTYPLRDGSGALQAILFASVDLLQIGQMTAQVQLPGPAELLIVKSDGTVLAYLPGDERLDGTQKPAARLLDVILAEGEGEVEMRGSDGVKRFHAFTPLSSMVETGLHVSVGIPVDWVYTEANRLLTYQLLGLALITALALLIVWVATDAMVMKRVHALVATAQRLSSGDLKARTGLSHSEGELDRIARAFDDMAEALEHRAVQLSEAETRYRTLVEQLPMVTYIARPDEFRSILYISPQVQDILGFSREDWTADGRLWLRLIHPEDRDHVQESLEVCLTGGGPFRCQYRIFTKGGEPLWFQDEALAIRSELGELLHLQGVMRDITEQRLAARDLLHHQDLLRSLSSQLSLVEERERHRIATDLHDRVGQTLALCKIKLGLLKNSAASSPYAEPVEEIRKIIMEAIKDTRSLTFKISCPILYELGIDAALEWLAEQTQKEHGIDVRYETDGLPKSLDNDVRILLFRAAGELLTNVVKHSRASRAGIEVTREEGYIHIRVWDEGVGFTVKEAGSTRRMNEGFGLFSIRERLEHARGFMTIDSNPGRGAAITIAAPLSPTPVNRESGLHPDTDSC